MAKKSNMEDLRRLISIGKEKGYLTYDEVNSALPDDLVSSEKIDDPFVEVRDNVANVEKSDLVEKMHSKTMLERTWTEAVTRAIKIKNKNDREIDLTLKVLDNPAQELTFQESTPKPTREQAPEYIFELKVEPEGEIILNIRFTLQKKETIKIPVGKVGFAQVSQVSKPGGAGIPSLAQEALSPQKDDFLECESPEYLEEYEEPLEEEDLQ